MKMNYYQEAFLIILCPTVKLYNSDDYLFYLSISVVACAFCFTAKRKRHFGSP